MAFGKVRHSQILSQAGNTWDVEIYKNGFSGTSLEFNMQGEGFEITWNGQGDTLDTHFFGSELTLYYYVENQTDENFMYNEVLATGEKNFYIRIYKTESGSTKKIWWYGWLTPAFDNIENTPFPYVMQLTATDSYGFFKSRDKDSFFNYDDKIAYRKITEIIGIELPPSGASATDLRGFIGRMNLLPDSVNNDTPCPFYINGASGDVTSVVKTQIDWYRRNADNSIRDYNITYLPNQGSSNQSLRDPFFNYYFSKSVFSEADSFDEDDQLILPTGSALEYKESDVFDSILKCFNAVGFLSEGSYIFRQQFNYKQELDGTVITQPYQSANHFNRALASRPGSFLSNDLLTINQSTNVVLGGSILNYEPSLKKVTIDFDEGFSIANVVQGTLLDTRVQIGTITSQDQGPIALTFSAIATEVITEPNVVGGASPAYTVGSAFISPGGIRTNSRLQISILLPSGNRRYLRQTLGSNELTWGSPNQDATLDILRGNNVFSSGNTPINSTSLMANEVNMDPYNGIPTNGDIIKTELTGTNQRTTTTLIEFNCAVQKPPETGLLELQMVSRNATTGDFTGYYSQCLHNNFTSQYEPFPTAPTFVSTKTEVNNIKFDYTDLEEGESVTSTVTYSSNQAEVPSNKIKNLGTSLLGQTPINPLASIAFRKGTKASDGTSAPSTYPIMNESDQFEIQPCITGFVRSNSAIADSLNLLRLLAKERLNLQYKPLEILQADIYSPTISPSKLIKYKINGNSGDFKYYVFKGGTFKAQSDTMTGEWFKIKEPNVTITTTSNPGFPNGFANIEKKLAQLTTRIAQQNAIIETIAQSNSFTTLSEARSTKVLLDHLDVVAIPTALLDTQSVILSMPDGSSPVNLTLSGAASNGSIVLNTNNFTPDQTYPIGSLVSLNQSFPAPTP